jgi:hypothetical protein
MSYNLRVFLSSTFSDLKEYRAAAISTLQRFGFVTLTFETLGAMDEAPAAVSARAVAEADIAVFLVAHRYGYIAPGSVNLASCRARSVGLSRHGPNCTTKN